MYVKNGSETYQVRAAVSNRIRSWPSDVKVAGSDPPTAR